MSQFIANHSMENFFINPTMTQDNSMENFARISIVGEATPKVRFDDFPASEGSKEEKIARPVSTIQDLFLSHNFLSYHSEEESASPRDSSDSLSLHSDDDVLLETPLAELGPETPAVTPSAMDLFLVPEELANSCTKIEHRCNRAQAVVLKPVGKPKVVSMPKLVDVRPGHFKRVSTESFRSNVPVSLRRPESRKSIRSTTSSRASYDRTEPIPTLPISVLSTPLETPLETPAEETTESIAPDPETPSAELPKHEPSVPLIRAANAFDPFPRLADIAAGNLSRKDLLKRSLTISGMPSHSSEGLAISPSSPAKRRLHRLASTISTASDIVRRKSSMSSLRNVTSPVSASPSPRPSLLFDQSGPSTPAGPIPRRRSSMGKLTPRGPTERAPILVLPPFPDDDEEDDDFGDASASYGLPKWDRPAARHAMKIRKERPSIDGIVAGSG